jgi:hypothetical protein
MYCLLLTTTQGIYASEAPSTAVAKATLNEVVKVHEHVSKSIFFAGDVKTAAAVLRVQFANLEEVGSNARIEAAVLANPDLLNIPSTDSILQMAQQVRAVELQDGFDPNFGYTQLLDLFKAVQEQKTAVLAEIKSVGMKGVEANIADGLDKIAASLPDAVSLDSAVARRAMAQFRKTNFVVCWLGAYAAAAGGIAALSFEFPPVAAAFGVVSAIYGILAIFFC